MLVIRSMETGKERELPLTIARMSGMFQAHWSPDGRSLLAEGEDLKGRHGIYQIDAQTGTVTPIEQNCCVEWSVWSPDGKIVFTSNTMGQLGEPTRIVARDLDTGREQELYRVVSPVAVSHLAISPDAQRLAFVWADLQEGKWALKIMPAAGGEPCKLVELPAQRLDSFSRPQFALAWSPNSRHIIYATSVPGVKSELQLWRISVAGGRPQSLGGAMEGLTVNGLSVHPDGRQIAFTARNERKPPSEDIWVLRDFLPALKSPKSKQN